MTAFKLKYRLKSFLSVDIDNNELREKLGQIIYPNGEPMAEIWHQPKGRLYNQYFDNDEGKLPDISDWVGNMVLSPQAYKVLREPLEACGELLPITLTIDGSEQTWFVFNVTAICNAVDKTKSEQDIMDGMIMGVHSLEFQADADLPLVFRTDFDRRMGVYCSEKLKAEITASNILGPIFRDDLSAHL